MFDIILRVIKVYYSFTTEYHIDDKIEIEDFERQRYISTITDKERKAQSIKVWKLLEFALKKDFSINDMQFERCENGSWQLKNGKPFFSLSHSKGLVVVAIDEENNIGVDVELVSNKILKIQKLFPNLSNEQINEDRLTLEWTKKESLFKNKKGKNFVSNKIFNNGNYYYVTACVCDSNVQFIEVKFIDTI